MWWYWMPTWQLPPRPVFLRRNIPDRFIDCGIAECNMIGIAAGLATCGKIPFAASFRHVFGRAARLSRCAIPLAYPKLNVKIAGSHAGISAGEDGATHQCCEDIALDAHHSRHGRARTPADHYEMIAAVKAAA